MDGSFGAHAAGAARGEEAEPSQRGDQHVVRMHVRRMRPGADGGVERRRRIQPAKCAHERNGLVACGDNVVGPAPPELQGDARRGDRAHVRRRAAGGVGTRIGPRRAADLGARERPQAVAERRPPSCEAAAVAADAGEVAVADRHVRDRVERRRTCEQRRMARDEQQGLLSAHARAERVDPRTVEAEPGDRVADDLRHAREVVDLPGVAPGEIGEPSSLALGIHHGEGPERRQVAPALHVLQRRDTAPVRRDDQR